MFPIKISTQTRYALRFLTELALKPPQTRMTTRSIALEQGLSEKYLEAIATKLRRGGYISSIKGAGGGYVLSRDPENVTVGDIMRLMETTFFQVSCADKDCPQCVKYSQCPLRGIFEGVKEQLTTTLDGVNLANLRDSYQRAPYQDALLG